MATGKKEMGVYRAETTLLSHLSKLGCPGIKIRSGSFPFLPVAAFMLVLVVNRMVF